MKKFRKYLAIFKITHSCIKIKLVLLAATTLSAQLFNFTPSYAVSTIEDRVLEIHTIAQYDSDGDNSINLVIIDCSFATESDQVLVYKQKGHMNDGSEWEELINFVDEVWLFDVGSDGTAQLIIEFTIAEGLYTAYIYDDVDGDGKVDFSVDGKNIIIQESDFWRVQVTSDQPWDQVWDYPHANITMYVDGYASLAWAAGYQIQNDDIGLNGMVDWVIEIGDKNDNGINDYQVVYAVSPYFKYLYRPTHNKLVIFECKSGNAYTPYSNDIFWPLLFNDTLDTDHRYFDHPPIVAVDWETASLSRIGVRGFPIETGYHIYSRLPIELNQVNAANWENPMAYFDLANDHDSNAELQIRFDVRVPNDPYFPEPYAGYVETPNLEVNVSWDQDNNSLWDYQLSLGSNQAIEEVVDFPDFSITSVPYDQVIPWVWGRTWDAAMLVFDSRPSSNSEGMFGKGWKISRGYDGEDIGSGLDTQYMMGFSDQPPYESFEDIQPFMRGEYNFAYFDMPKVYLGALDRQLHLYTAQSGVWNLGDGRYLRYANLDGDPYLDQWTLEKHGILQRQLNYQAGFYLYSGQDQVVLQHAEHDPALLITAPPGTHEDWLYLGRMLKDHAADADPDDFLALLAMAPGSPLTINNAASRGFRPTDEGFRFILSLMPDFEIQGPDLLGLAGTPPGDYLLTYDGDFHLQPLTPRAIQVASPDPAHLQLIQHTSGSIPLTLTNTGLEDAENLYVYAFLQRDGHERLSADYQSLRLNAGESKTLRFPFALDAVGAWELRVGLILFGDGSRSIERTNQSFNVNVRPAPGTDFNQELTAFGLVQPWQVAALVTILLFSISLFVVLLVGQVSFKASRKTESQN